MVQKSRGPRRKSRHKMQVRTRATITQFMRTFNVGDSVHIDLQPNIAKRGYPYVMFQGLTGKIVERRGSAYVVQIRDHAAQKKVILKAVHLKAAKI